MELVETSRGIRQGVTGSNFEEFLEKLLQEFLTDFLEEFP